MRTVRCVYAGVAGVPKPPRAFVGAARVNSLSHVPARIGWCRESCRRESCTIESRSQNSHPWMRSFTTLRGITDAKSSDAADAVSALRKTRWEAFFREIGPQPGDAGSQMAATAEKTENDDTKNPFTKGKVFPRRSAPLRPFHRSRSKR